MPPSYKIGDRLLGVAQVAGVVATGWLVWIHNVRPRLGLGSLAGMFAGALLYVALAWICCGVVTFGVYFVVSLAELPEATRFSLRTSAPAMWFAPAIVLLSVPLPGAFALSLFLVANATRQLISQWGVVESPIRRMEPASRLPALLGSFTAQAGLVAMLWGHPFGAAALFAMSAAILTSLSIATGAYRPGRPPALPHSALSVVWTFLLAASFTFGGISARGWGGAPGPEAQPAAQPDPALPVPAAEGMGPGGDFPGVILLPPLQPYATLVAPAIAPRAGLGVHARDPVGIPFSGQYWIFRWPAERPPRRSVVRRGNAAELSFHTTDGARLEMEAHQKLDPPISVHCCSQIQLAIQNTDEYPGTVSIELILVDTSVAINLVQSLGSVAPGYPPPAGQLLSFPVPPATAVRNFDEIKVIFHRDRIRADKSARIAIERFVLVP